MLNISDKRNKRTQRKNELAEKKHAEYMERILKSGEIKLPGSGRINILHAMLGNPWGLFTRYHKIGEREVIHKHKYSKKGILEVPVNIIMLRRTPYEPKPFKLRMTQLLDAQRSKEAKA